MSHKDLRREAESNHKSKLTRIGGSDAAADRKMIISAVRQHEANDHKGQKPTKLKLRRGGVADDNDGDEKPAARLDRPGRARGGSAKHKGAHVNVIVAPQMHPPAAGGPGAPPPPGAPMMPPPHPPMPMPPPAGAPMMPPGGAPGGAAGGPPIGAIPHPPMMPGMPPRKRGGSVTQGRAHRDSGGQVVGPMKDSVTGKLKTNAEPQDLRENDAAIIANPNWRNAKVDSKELKRGGGVTKQAGQSGLAPIKAGEGNDTGWAADQGGSHSGRGRLNKIRDYGE